MKTGAEYLLSDEKCRFDLFVANAASPATALAIGIARLSFHPRTQSLLLGQERRANDGRTITISKIRTLAEDNETPLGRMAEIFRKVGLDELPQLESVRRGDMSIFGRRPLLEDEDDAWLSTLSKTPDGQRLLAMHDRYVAFARCGFLSSFGFAAHSEPGLMENPKIRYGMNVYDHMHASFRYDLRVALSGIAAVTKGEFSTEHLNPKDYRVM